MTHMHVSSANGSANGSGEPFFSHQARRPPGPLNSATRFLCAAAYLNRDFASRVIGNLLVTRRAVAPSVSFDVGPVLRHCLRARRNLLIRDGVLVAFVTGGLIVRALETIDFLVFALALGLLLPRAWRRDGGRARTIAFAVGGVVAVVIALALAVFLIFGGLPPGLTSSHRRPAPGGAGITSLAAMFIALATATWATELMYRYITFRILAEAARSGRARPRAASAAAERRIELVEGAQHGNITLHAGWFPFVGAGSRPNREWSITTRLDRADDETAFDNGHSTDNDKYVHIDPVDVHKWIGERLRALSDPGLPENERITALTVTDRLVGSGWLHEDDPLFDAYLKTPYSHASREAVEAVIRHPQARLRYYQQVSLSDEGPAVVSRGRTVVDGVDQEISVSAFIYAAVEGHMLYLQFVLTALPPISDLYRIADFRNGTSVPGILAGSTQRVFSAIVAAPFGICAAFGRWLRERHQAKTRMSYDGDDYGYDYGASVSVRELAAASKFSTYVEELDVKKYNSIISRLLLDSVADYLVDKGVKTASFMNSARNIINGDVINISGNTAPVSNVGSITSTSAPATDGA